MQCKHPHIFRIQTRDPYHCLACGVAVKVEPYEQTPVFEKGMTIGLKNFGSADGNYRIGNISADTLHLELCDE